MNQKLISDRKNDIVSQSCKKILRPCVDSSPGSPSAGRNVHSCCEEPGSSLVSVCQRSTFVPLFFRQSIQCCRVSPCEWQPNDTPPNQRHRKGINADGSLIHMGLFSNTTSKLTAIPVTLFFFFFFAALLIGNVYQWKIDTVGGSDVTQLPFRPNKM